MVFAGLLNKKVAAAISAEGQPAVGISAADSRCFLAEPMVHNEVEGSLGFDFLKTVYRTAAATLIAAVIAIPLGIVLGSSERLYHSLEFVIDFFRSTPASAMFPLFLVLFGVGDEATPVEAAHLEPVGAHLIDDVRGGVDQGAEPLLVLT